MERCQKERFATRRGCYPWKILRNNCSQGASDRDCEHLGAYTRLLYIGLARNAHQLFLVIINGVKKPGKNLPSLRQVYTMAAASALYHPSPSSASRSPFSLLSLTLSLSFAFSLSSEHTVGVVVVGVAAAEQATSFLLRSSCSRYSSLPRMPLFWMPTFHSIACVTRPSLSLFNVSFLPPETVCVCLCVCVCVRAYALLLPGSRLIIPSNDGGCCCALSLSLSLSLSLCGRCVPLSRSTFRFINIHRWLIDDYDFLALPSGFSAIPAASEL